VKSSIKNITNWRSPDFLRIGGLYKDLHDGVISEEIDKYSLLLASV